MRAKNGLHLERFSFYVLIEDFFSPVHIIENEQYESGRLTETLVRYCCLTLGKLVSIQVSVKQKLIYFIENRFCFRKFQEISQRNDFQIFDL